METELRTKTMRGIMREHRIPLTSEQRRYLKMKRIFDIVVSGMALVVLAIPFLFVAALQKLSSPNEPVFFGRSEWGRTVMCFIS